MIPKTFDKLINKVTLNRADAERQLNTNKGACIFFPDKLIKAEELRQTLLTWREQIRINGELTHTVDFIDTFLNTNIEEVIEEWTQ
jgi:hypothetical protein